LGGADIGPHAATALVAAYVAVAGAQGMESARHA